MPTFTRKLSDLINENFDFGLKPADYPIFNETYREGLNKKILEHYWNYEIGQETESMFRFSLNRKMREIMPYYNQLYSSAQIEFDPLRTIDFTDMTNTTNTSNGTTSTTTEGASTNTSETDTSTDTLGKSRSVSSTTPQVQLSGNEDYASSAADANSNTTVSGHGTGSENRSENASANSSHNDSGSGTIERTLQGYQGISPADMLMKYRDTFLNIDMEIIRNLETLFMQIWDNGDEFSDNSAVVNWGYRYGLGLL